MDVLSKIQDGQKNLFLFKNEILLLFTQRDRPLIKTRELSEAV